MSTTTLSSREFNQDLARAKRAAKKGPVIVTDRGRPAYVLTNFEEYSRSQTKRLSLFEALAMPEEDDINLEAFLPQGAYYARHIDLD